MLQILLKCNICGHQELINVFSYDQLEKEIENNIKHNWKNRSGLWICGINCFEKWVHQTLEFIKQ